MRADDGPGGPRAVAPAPALARALARALAPALALVGGLAAAVAGLIITGAAAPSVLFDPGPLVRWGLPLVTVTGQLAAAVTIGVLVLTAVVLPVPAPSGSADGRGAPARPTAHPPARPTAHPPARPTAHPPARPTAHPPARPTAHPPALRLVTGAGAVWTLATVAQLVLQFSQTSGTPLGDPAFGQQLLDFVRQADAGRGLATTIAVAVVVTTAAAGARTLTTAGVLAALSLVALVPPALAGHSAGSSDYETAVTSLGLHLLGACVWTGGLVGLLVLRPRHRTALPVVVRRYSALAGWAFALVAASGVINGVIRVPRPAGLLSSYGLLLGLKAVASGLLGVTALVHRRRRLPALADGRAFARLAAVEVAVMGAAFGLAAALAASPPPPVSVPALPTLAQAITGYSLPPPPTPLHWLTQWQPDLLWLLVAATAAGMYGGALHRLRTRGDRWPVPQAISWNVGVLVLVYVTCGPPAVYGRVLFSAHLIGHLALSTVVPVLLGLGAPVTLALRALTPRGDGSRGPREWLLVALESRAARALSFPPMAALLLVGSLVLLYASPLLGLALRTYVGRELAQGYLVLAGYVFARVVIGPDPGRDQVGQALRLSTLLGVLAFHAWFGAWLRSGSSVLQAGYFGGLGRTWGPSLLADQRLGGWIAWGLGDLPAIVLVAIIVVRRAPPGARDAPGP